MVTSYAKQTEDIDIIFPAISLNQMGTLSNSELTMSFDWYDNNLRVSIYVC